MSDEPTVRSAEADDVKRVRELAESSMTASCALSPQDIETILETTFGEEAQHDRLDGDAVALVAEVDGVLAGFVEGTLSDGEGTVRWLQVDPERRGRGVGTALVERAVADLRERGAEDVRAVVLAADTEGETFYEGLGFEQTDEREVDIGGLETAEHVFAEGDGAAAGEKADDEATGGETERDREDGTEADGPESAAGGASAGEESVPDPDVPETATVDGEEVYLGGDPLAGTEDAFVPTFTDADRTEKYGFYCANCGSSEVSVDSMERLVCGNCENTHKADDDYDGSYL